MPLLVLEDALSNFHSTVEEKDFAQAIRDARDAIGLKQYRAAEFIGITCGRLKNLETGYFRDMPTQSEIQGLARLYDLNQNTLEKKALEHCEERSVRKKIRTIHGSNEMQPLRAV